MSKDLRNENVYKEYGLYMEDGKHIQGYGLGMV